MKEDQNIETNRLPFNRLKRNWVTGYPLISEGVDGPW